MKEIKFFHPSGKSMPNGCHYQRGGFLAECRHNSNSFQGSDNPDGAIIVLSETNRDNQVVEDIVAMIESQNNKAESGYFFYGKYVTDKGRYGIDCWCIRISNISFERMKKLVRPLKTNFSLTDFLIKHSDSDKIFIS